MKIIKLILNSEGVEKNINFGKKTLIHSDNNSSGKSTLLRLLFHSLGYNIPSTKGLNFKNFTTYLHIENKFGINMLKRTNDHITLYYDDGAKQFFFLPNDEMHLLSLIWESDDENILKSILGSIYMDQDKGWTLLNRGTVIGNIKFNIEDFLEGVSNRDLSYQKIELENIKTEIKKHTQLLSIIEYKNFLSKSNNSIFPKDYNIDLDNQLQLLILNKKQQTKKINDLNLSRKENKQFIEYIERMQLRVKDPETDIEIPVTKDTIIYFNDNQNYIDAHLLILQGELSIINKKISELELEIKKVHNLFSIKSEIEKIDSILTQIDVPYEKLYKTITYLKKQKNSLHNEIKEKLSVNNDVLNRLHFNILKYAKRLGVDKYINTNKNYVFTSDLKSLSGAVLHKIVFSFKMSYILELQNCLGFKLPIVLDSPSGRELDQKNVEETFDIINDDFSQNQIIIASIYEYKNFAPDSKVELVNQLFEQN
ncbi:hypothetical protein BFC19_07560 [Brochothrix thermosphacta]|uniref:hypothetical protein n=1 Tax=Brochothrix thermosphacta TaxID=2756 RepID=UPI000E75A888|nr:hypothetical protein [Brochothrix thermosphacta]ANZ95245.1 hypothetical protein BFC19_07560 [Brochothrix thermosphacta]